MPKGSPLCFTHLFVHLSASETMLDGVLCLLSHLIHSLSPYHSLAPKMQKKKQTKHEPTRKNFEMLSKSLRFILRFFYFDHDFTRFSVVSADPALALQT